MTIRSYYIFIDEHGAIWNQNVEYASNVIGNIYDGDNADRISEINIERFREDNIKKVKIHIAAISPFEEPFNYFDAWKNYWTRWIGNHSMLRCPGPPCPGGCGASAKDALAELIRCVS